MKLHQILSYRLISYLHIVSRKQEVTKNHTHWEGRDDGGKNIYPYGGLPFLHDPIKRGGTSVPTFEKELPPPRKQWVFCE